MQRLVRTALAASLVAGLILVSTPTSHAATVSIHPSPGDLSSVEGLGSSDDFSVNVNGRTTFVYKGEDGGNRVSFVGFAFTGGAVDIEITMSAAIGSYSVLPSPGGVSKPSAATLRITGLAVHTKFRVGADITGKGWRYLVVSAEPPETAPPSPADPNVVYLGPGVHYRGKAWNPFSGTTKRHLYLAPGAVLEATLDIASTDGVRITGRGVIAAGWLPSPKPAGRVEWWHDNMGIHIRHSDDVLVEGITAIALPSYQLEVADGDGVTIRNVKLLGHADGTNNDGIHAYSRNVLVEDAFIAGNDDRFAFAGLYDSGDHVLRSTTVADVSIKDVVLWGLNATKHLHVSWNTDLDVTGVDVAGVFTMGHASAPLLGTRFGGAGTISGIRVRDVYHHNSNLVDLNVVAAHYGGSGGGSISDVVLEDIDVASSRSSLGTRLAGLDQGGRIDHVELNDVKANGELITTLSGTAISTNAYVTDVRFNQAGTPSSYEAESPVNAMTGTTNLLDAGRLVGNLGNGAANRLSVPRVHVPATGAYTLRIHYATKVARNLDISVNGGAAARVSLPATGGWYSAHVQSRTTAVNLTAGGNTLVLSNDGAYAPNIDRLEVLGG